MQERAQRDWTTDALTWFGLFAVSAVLIACALGSAHEFTRGAWPFGLVEAA
jgi:hypothetical protein